MDTFFVDNYKDYDIYDVIPEIKRATVQVIGHLLVLFKHQSQPEPGT